MDEGDDGALRGSYRDAESSQVVRLYESMVMVVGFRTCRINTVIALIFNLIVKLKSNKAQKGKYFHQSRDVGVGFLQYWH